MPNFGVLNISVSTFTGIKIKPQLEIQFPTLHCTLKCSPFVSSSISSILHIFVLTKLEVIVIDTNVYFTFDANFSPGILTSAVAVDQYDFDMDC